MLRDRQRQRTAVSTAANYEATQAQADTKDLKAQMLKLDAMNEEDMAHLRKILEQIQDQVAQASLMLAGSFCHHEENIFLSLTKR